MLPALPAGEWFRLKANEIMARLKFDYGLPSDNCYLHARWQAGLVMDNCLKEHILRREPFTRETRNVLSQLYCIQKVTAATIKAGTDGREMKKKLVSDVEARRHLKTTDHATWLLYLDCPVPPIPADVTPIEFPDTLLQSLYNSAGELNRSYQAKLFTRPKHERWLSLIHEAEPDGMKDERMVLDLLVSCADRILANPGVCGPRTRVVLLCLRALLHPRAQVWRIPHSKEPKSFLDDWKWYLQVQETLLTTAVTLAQRCFPRNDWVVLAAQHAWADYATCAYNRIAQSSRIALTAVEQKEINR